jgi:hypothetical protein
MSNLFQGQSEITQQIREKMNSVMNNMPGGQIPENISLAKLKGIAPNINTIKTALSPDTGVPERYLAEFNPLNDLVKTIPIPTPKLKTIDFTPKEPKIEDEIDEAKLLEEGVPEKKIAELKRKREARQKANEVKTEISNKIQSSIVGQANNLIGGVQNMAQSAISGAVTSAIGSINSPIIQKIAAYKYFKAQLGTVDERVANIQEQIDKIKEEAKEVLKKQTESIEQKGEIEKEEKKQESETKQAESKADAMVPTSPGHPGPGNKADSKTTRKAKELREKVEGFKANAEQTFKNIGKLLTDILGSLGNLLSIILKVIGAILSVIAFIMFLKQLLELLMLLLFKKSNKTSGNNENSRANTPEEFLNEIGYPGLTNEDFSNLSTPLSPTLFDTTNTNFTNADLFDPIMFGSSQIGDPLTQGDLDIDSGKDFNNHPLLGNLEGIHPQLTNQLYNNGTLPLLGEEPLDVNQYSEDLDKLYDDILNEFVETQQIEYIEKLYNLDFEMIGYKRYKA